MIKVHKSNYIAYLNDMHTLHCTAQLGYSSSQSKVMPRLVAKIKGIFVLLIQLGMWKWSLKFSNYYSER